MGPPAALAANETGKAAYSSATVPELLSRFDTARHTLSIGDPVVAYGEFEALAPAVPEARLVLVSLLRHGIGCRPQPGRAWRVLETLLDLDWAPPLLLAALWLRDTKAVDAVFDRSIVKDDARSVQLLERVVALEPENSDALCALGIAKLEGNGCDRSHTNYYQGLHHLEKAMSLGHTDATYEMAEVMIHRGLREKDQVYFEHGFSLLKWIADSGHAYANLKLGEYCRSSFNGKIVSMMKKLRCPIFKEGTQLRKNADAYDHRAGDLGAPKGYHQLGVAYSKGLSAEGANFDKAVKYFQMSIDGGVLGDYDNLGYHFEKGGDVRDKARVDQGEALRWYTLGYEKREPWSTLHLANAYDDGLGVAVDHNRAEGLYNEAVEFAEAEGDSMALESAKKERQSLYTARYFLGNEEDKYEKLLGDPRRLKQATALVSKMQNRGAKSRRRASAPATGEWRTLMKQLELFVGVWSAKEIEGRILMELELVN